MGDFFVQYVSLKAVKIIVILRAMRLVIEYEVENLHCKKCVEKIELALMYTAGIETSEVNFEEKQVKVKINPFQITSKKIKMMLLALGFSAMII